MSLKNSVKKIENNTGTIDMTPFDPFSEYLPNTLRTVLKSKWKEFIKV